MNKIAIIGMANLFPGSQNPQQFWQNLLDNLDTRSRATPYQMEGEPERFLGTKGENDKYYCMNGGYISDFDFDASGFALPADQLEKLDDLFQWSLHVAREALRDSGYLDKTELLSRCGVILGNLSFPTKSSNHLFMPLYQQAVENGLKEILQDPDFSLQPFAPEREVADLNAAVAGLPSTLIAKALNLAGSCLSLDAACASSVYSVKLACDYLLTGKADLMLAGAVSGADPLFVNMGFSIFQAYPEDNSSSPLGKNSQGLFAGEGAGVLVLKRYDEAIADGDQIYGEILGVGLSNDGKGQFVLSPNSKGQVLAYERAYSDANIDVRTVDYIECHATGTPLGDKVELKSMETFFDSRGSRPMIGSVKSNLGHLLTAAGMPGMMKVLHAMRESLIPPTINLSEPQSSPNGAFGPGNMPTTNTTWPQTDHPKRAGVSVFGFGGCNAHLVVQEPGGGETHAEALAQAAEPMSIVAMDAFFGPCIGSKNFLQTVHNGQQHFVDLPAERWHGLDAEPDVLARQGLNQVPKGAYIDQFDFDFMHFKVPPNNDDCLIPQQLMLMKVADGVVQEAGLKDGSNVAILVAMGVELELHQFRGRVNLTTQVVDSLAANGIELTDEQAQQLEEIAKGSVHDAAQLNQYTSFIGNIMASRISSLRDYSGPAFTISAEENSVFRCLEVADNLFRTSDVEAVVVAAVDLAGSAENIVLRNRLIPLNPGSSMSYDAASAGFSVGEGAGAVVLKRESDAKRDGNTIYANISGMGSALGDNADAIAEAAQRALENADVNATEVDLVEVAASGFPHQDQNEFAAFDQVFGQQSGSVALASVKANIGHTFAASGIASLIKTALCVHHRFVPALAGWQASRFGDDNSALYAPTESKAWHLPSGQQRRAASVSSLGIDGVATNLILTEAPEQIPEPILLTQSGPYLLPLAGANEAALKAALAALKSAVAGADLARLATDTYYQWQATTTNNNAGLTLALVADNSEQLLQEIQFAEQGIGAAIASGSEWQSPRGSCLAAKPLGKDGKVTFVYPGGFTSYIGQGRELYQMFPDLHQRMAHHSSRMLDMTGDYFLHPRSLKALTEDDTKPLARNLLHTPLMMFESGISYAKALTEVAHKILGIQPSNAIGYSMGEISMMYALDVWNSSDQMSHILQTSPVFRTRLAGPMETVREQWQVPGSAADGSFWTGFTLKASQAQVQAVVGNYDKVDLLLTNTPSELVIGGDPDQCQQLIGELGCEAFPAAMSDVIHCPLVQAERELLYQLHLMDVNPAPNVDLISAVGYQPVAANSGEAVANNIADMYCNPVDFPRLVETAYAAGSRIFIELGPRDSCSKYVAETLADRDHVSVAFNRRGVSDKGCLVRALAQLVSHGVASDLSSLYLNETAAEKKRGLIKPVQLGGKRIHDTIVTPANKQAMQGAKRTKGAIAVEKTQKSASVNLLSNTDVTAPRVTAPSEVTPSEVAPSPTTPAADVDTAAAAARPKRVRAASQPRAERKVRPSLAERRQQRQAAKTESTAAAESASKLSFKDSFKDKAEARKASAAERRDQRRADKAAARAESRQTKTSKFSLTSKRQAASNNKTKEVAMTTRKPVSKDQAEAIAAPQLAIYRDNMNHASQLHGQFLENRQRALESVAELIDLQIDALQPGSTQGAAPAASQAAPVVTRVEEPQAAVPATPAVAAPAAKDRQRHTVELVEKYSKPHQVIWDTDALVEFAEGKIGNVFGPEYAVIDNYHRRVRLPTTDYLLVTRVTDVDAKINEFKPCSMATEYDIPTDAPYLVAGQIPWAVAVESGQCDLMLISYLGIDFECKGERVYRLLDCTLTFLDDLPKGGETLRYEIKINNYARNGDTLLFFFCYECFVDDKMVLKMDGGCAGFFTDEELADGKGVIETDEEIAERTNAIKQSFTPFLTTDRTSYEYEDIHPLIYGDVGACFGPEYDQGDKNPALCFSSEKFLMIERVSKIERQGGAWGLGLVEGHKQLDPNHWYFPCHFKDDQVMAGSLMAEGCGQLVSFFMMYLGMHTQAENARFFPMPGLPQKVRCRGQVLPQSAVLTYRMEIKEIGLSPTPYAIANVDIILDGKVIVDFKNLGVIIKEEGSADFVRPTNPTLWLDQAAADVSADYGDSEFPQLPNSDAAPLMRIESDLSAKKLKGVTPIKHIEAPAVPNDNRVPNTVPFTPYHLFEFATGDISKCFGADYDIYKDLIPPRTPCGDLQLTTRVIEVKGERGNFKNKAYCKAEYEVPAEAWYFAANSHESVMPYSVLMEISLQPNGFISTYVGTTLGFPGQELFFRNLDGEGTILRDVDLRGKTIVNDSTLVSTVISGSNIIQSFEFLLSTDGEPFYKGSAVFGYFTDHALTHQLGLDRGNITTAWHIENNTPKDQVTVIDSASKALPFYQAPAGQPNYRLAGGRMNFIDTVEIVDNGGKEGKGYIYAERTIDPTDWFFPFHFHQDPVMPGSLGVEAIIESMQVYAMQHDLGAKFKSPKFGQIQSKIIWKYRGQINPLNKKMQLDVHITKVEDQGDKVIVMGDANLMKDGLRIYEVKDVVICLEES